MTVGLSSLDKPFNPYHRSSGRDLSTPLSIPHGGIDAGSRSRSRPPKLEDLIALKEMIEAGQLMPVIDRTYPLSETPQAMDHVGMGHAHGKVAITV